MQKIKVYHFHNGGGGGVFTVIKNLLKYSRNIEIENHVIYTINKEVTPCYRVSQLDAATSQQVFYYSPKWNFYYTCRQLAKLLPGDKALIVAHDWLELGMVSHLGLQNPVIHFVHGNYDYYYDLAKRHEQSTDRWITVSPVIYSKLCTILPHRETGIQYCRFPVAPVKAVQKENEVLRIFYCVQSLTDENKQFKILPLINASLKNKGIAADWTIVGDDINREEVEKLMNQQQGITLYPSLPNEEIIKLLPAHDLFILPSLKEGFPVAAVEAMKGGAVPLVTNWEGATEELIIENETGYYFETGDLNGYADTILFLHTNRKLLKRLSGNGVKKANELFDPFINTKNIEAEIITAYHSVRKPKPSFKVYGSRLDHPLISNTAVNVLRSLLFSIKNSREMKKLFKRIILKIKWITRKKIIVPEMDEKKKYFRIL